MAAVTICIDFVAQENSLSLFPLFPHLFAIFQKTPHMHTYMYYTHHKHTGVCGVCMYVSYGSWYKIYFTNYKENYWKTTLVGYIKDFSLLSKSSK